MEFCFSVVVLTATFLYFIKVQREKPKRPPMVPHSMFRVFREMTSPHYPKYLLNVSREFGPVFGLRLPQFAPFYAVTSPKLAKLILEGDKSLGIEGSDKPDHIYKQFNGITSGHYSIFTRRTVDKRWADARKKCLPCFSKSNIDQKLPALQNKVAAFCDVLESFADTGKPCNNMETWLVKLTLDFISTSLIGVGFNFLSGKSSNNEINVFLEELDFTVNEVALKQKYNPFRKYCFWIPEVQRARRSAKKMLAVAKQLLQEQKLKQNDCNPKQGITFTSCLLNIPYKTDEERAADLIIMIMAGYETTSFQLTWALVEISRNKSVLQKLQSELDSAMPLTKDKFQADMIGTLPYLNCIINEVMRLRPVGANGSIRELGVDVEYNNFCLPKGSTVVMPIYTMCRAENIENCEEFIPERWSSSNKAENELLKEMFMPFSLGKRNCIGQKLALWEMQYILAIVFRRFNLEFIGDLEWSTFLTLRPNNAHFKVTRRADTSARIISL